jgi:hypothetical protein
MFSEKPAITFGKFLSLTYPMPFVNHLYFLNLYLISTHWILDRRRVEDAMKEDLEYIDIDTLTKIKMWYYNSTYFSHPRGYSG